MTTAICIATGPSLTKSDVEQCRGRGMVYAVKEAIAFAPWADVVYAADEDWWILRDGLPKFEGEKWTCNEPAARRYNLNHVDIDCDAAWGEGDVIASGGHSGFQAINLAVMHGATKVILLGYDMQRVGIQKHFYDAMPGLSRNSRASNYKQWLQRFRAAAPLIPVPVINASRESAIDCFPRMTLNRAFDA